MYSFTEESKKEGEEENKIVEAIHGSRWQTKD
jgi:hypothetical protein